MAQTDQVKDGERGQMTVGIRGRHRLWSSRLASLDDSAGRQHKSRDDSTRSVRTNKDGRDLGVRISDSGLWFRVILAYRGRWRKVRSRLRRRVVQCLSTFTKTCEDPSAGDYYGASFCNDTRICRFLILGEASSC